MSIVAVVSMKGGVGKTSLTATLGAAMAAKLGAGRVSVLDLDPQNALHWHFGLLESGVPGVAASSVQDEPWDEVARETEWGVTCLPYGAVTESQRLAFEALLAQNPNWVAAQLDEAGFSDDAVVVMDTPPGQSVYLKQAFACADVILMVIMADAGSYATIPAMEAWVEGMLRQRPGQRCFYVLNQVDRSDPLNRDVADVLQESLGTRLAPVGVHSDEAVREALAFQQPVLTYEPHGQASHDVDLLATWLIKKLSR